MSVVNLCPLIDLGAPTQVAYRLAAVSSDEISPNHKDSGHIRYVFDFGSSVVEGLKEKRELSGLHALMHSQLRRQPGLRRKYISNAIAFDREEQQDGISIHSFDWETPHACEHVISSSAYLDQIGPLKKEALTKVTKKDQDSGSEDEEQNLVPPAHTSHRQILRILFFVGYVLLQERLINCSHETQVDNCVTAPPFRCQTPARPAGDIMRTAPDHRFRVDEGRLVRWAHEDMSLEGEGELDVMVNGSDDLATQMKAPVTLTGTGMVLRESVGWVLSIFL
ncbi:hypothetical protein IMY05_C4468000100 [Salix suchowensis]|nr:hypothetical protein IMY05_C4468000100 [Salix suchowensis]